MMYRCVYIVNSLCIDCVHAKLLASVNTVQCDCACAAVALMSNNAAYISIGTRQMFYSLYTNTSFDKSCHAAFNLTSLSFYSDCECEAIPTVTRGNCSLRG
jgi:hypothetical protein